MNNVIFASFDPTVLTANPLSDLHAFKTLRLERATADFPKLHTIHKTLGVPVVLCTAANIRKYAKVKLFPESNAWFYDPFTGQHDAPITYKDIGKNTVHDILSRDSTPAEIKSFYKTCYKIAEKMD